MRVPDACAPEFEQIARVAREHLGPLADLDLSQFDLPACVELMAQARAKLLNGPGFACSTGSWSSTTDGTRARRSAGCRANLIGRVVAQKCDGTRLYDVRDTGKALAYGVRRSITNLEQEFHTDGGWLPLPPSFVGLYRLQPAAEGGMSRCASLMTVHHALRARPALLDRLYQPFLWNRQAEHAADDVTYSRAPIYRRAGERCARGYYDDYVRKGYALAGEPLDQPGADALEAMRELVEAEDNWIEFLLDRGQFLYLNNRQLAHSRTAFRDDDAKRHLMRFWNRDEGTPDLEGGRGATAHRARGRVPGGRAAVARSHLAGRHQGRARLSLRSRSGPAPGRPAAERRDQRAQEHDQAERAGQADQLGEAADRGRPEQEAEVADGAHRRDRGARRQPGRARGRRQRHGKHAGQAGADQAEADHGDHRMADRERQAEARRGEGAACAHHEVAAEPGDQTIAGEAAGGHREREGEAKAAAMLVPAPRLALRYTALQSAMAPSRQEGRERHEARQQDGERRPREAGALGARFGGRRQHRPTRQRADHQDQPGEAGGNGARAAPRARRSGRSPWPRPWRRG